MAGRVPGHYARRPQTRMLKIHPIVVEPISGGIFEVTLNNSRHSFAGLASR